MPKTNFTKVEEALTQGLEKIQKEKLLEEADRAQGKTRPESEEEKLKVIEKIFKDLKRLYKKDRKFFDTLKIDKEVLKNPKKMVSESLEALHDLEIHVSLHLSKLAKNRPQMSDEELIERESEKHIHKRFNVNDDWLPLD